MATITIDGIAKQVQEEWEITRVANARATFRFAVLSEDASYRPGMDDEVIVEHDGTALFGGEITKTRERGAENQGVAEIVTDVIASDFNSRASRRHVNETIPAGTLNAALQVLVTYLPGVTLDPLQVDGPALEELVYPDVKTEVALDDLQKLTNYIWEIDENEVLRMFEPGTVAAPFTLNGLTVLGDVEVEPTRDSYANRVIVRNKQHRVTAEDAGEIAAHDEWELAVTAADTLDEAALQAFADALLARSLPVLKKIVVRTDLHGLKPGQTVAAVFPKRNINNTYLITQVKIYPDGTDIIYEVTATEGLVYQAGARETYQRWNGGGLTINGAGGISTSTQRYAYFLGGNGLDATRSPVPTWMPASGGKAIGQGAIQVQLNTVPRGTLSALVTARLRALEAGVSVQARLYDVTDGAPCPGLSAVVTSTAWETVTFSVTLTAGSHLYELQLLPGAANKDVLGVGYVE